MCLERGEEHLRQVIVHHPEHAVALGRLGELHARQGRWDDARRVLAQALEILPVPTPDIQRLYDQAQAQAGSQR